MENFSWIQKKKSHSGGGDKEIVIYQSLFF